MKDYVIDPRHLTWTERKVWYPIAWVFNEIAFRASDFAWDYLLYPSLSFSIGRFFAGLALDREARTRSGDWK